MRALEITIEKNGQNPTNGYQEGTWSYTIKSDDGIWTDGGWPSKAAAKAAAKDKAKEIS